MTNKLMWIVVLEVMETGNSPESKMQGASQKLGLLSCRIKLRFNR